MIFLRLLFISLLITSCKTESINHSPKIISTSIINHETFNDSLQYKIIETKYRNKWNRNLVILVNQKIKSVTNIQKIPQKKLHMDGYFSSSKKSYIRVDHQTFSIIQITNHFIDFKIYETDTIIKQLFIDSTGNISIIELD